MSPIPRPSHADFTYQMKYGVRASSGGGAVQCAGDHRPGGGRRDCREDGWARPTGWRSWPGSARVGILPRPDLDRRSVTRRPLSMPPTVRCPDAGAGKAMMDAIVARPARRGFAGRGGHLRLPQGAGRLGRTGVRQAGGQAWPRPCCRFPRPRGLRSARGLPAPGCRGSEHNDPFVTAGRPPGDDHQQQRRASRAGFPTANRWCSGWPSSRPATIGLAQADGGFRRQPGDPGGQGPPRPLRGAPGGAHRGGDGRPGLRRLCPTPKNAFINEPV